jgi:hypothetical protein
VLDGDFLLTFAAVLVERLHLARIDPEELRRMLEVLLAPLERLPLDHRPPKALHRRIMRRDHLGREHALELVAGRQGLERGGNRLQVLCPLLLRQGRR